MEVKYLKVVKKENIFTKVINFFRIALYKKHQKVEESVVINTNINSKNNFLNKIKLEHEEDAELLRLQKQYENKEIELSSLSEEEIDKLNSLYKRQIEDLNKKLDNQKTELNIVKNRLKNYATSV